MTSLRLFYVQLDAVGSAIDFRRQHGLRVTLLGKQLLGQLDFLVLTIKSFLLSCANDLLSVQLNLVVAGREVRLKSPVFDDGAFPRERTFSFHECDCPASHGLAVKSHGAVNGRLTIITADY